MNRRRLRKALKRISHLPHNRFLWLYLFNKIKHFYLKATRSKQVAYPSTIMLELTNHCNLACTTCPREYDYGKEMDKGYMPVESARKIIDEIWPYVDSIGLTGMGETLMYNQAEEIAGYIKSKNKGIIISVSTNAQLPDFIRRIEKLIYKIDTIQVSIDGIGEVYENIRKKADFHVLDKNLRQLSLLCEGSGTDVMLNMVVTRENYRQMPHLISYAKETGIRYIDFTIFNLAAITNADTSYYEFYKSDSFLDILKELEIATRSHPDIIITNKNFKTDNGFRKCPFPFTHFYVCWNGFIVPCCAKPFPKEQHFGNVFDDKFIDVLNSRGFVIFRELWYKNTTPRFCEKCHYIDLEPIG